MPFSWGGAPDPGPGHDAPAAAAKSAAATCAAPCSGAPSFTTRRTRSEGGSGASRARRAAIVASSSRPRAARRAASTAGGAVISSTSSGIARVRLGQHAARQVGDHAATGREVALDVARDAVEQPMRLPPQGEAAGVAAPEEGVALQRLVVLAPGLGRAGDAAADEAEARIADRYASVRPPSAYPCPPPTGRPRDQHPPNSRLTPRPACAKPGGIKNRGRPLRWPGEKAQDVHHPSRDRRHLRRRRLHPLDRQRGRHGGAGARRQRLRRGGGGRLHPAGRGAAPERPGRRLPDHPAQRTPPARSR